MLIEVLLILCLQLFFGGFVHGRGNFLDHPQWKGKESCINHPIAKSANYKEETISEALIKTCTLIFDYNEKPDADEARSFCKAMYPDTVESEPKWNNRELTCIYRRLRKCLDDDAYLIDSKCVKISRKLSNYANAKIQCAQLQNEFELIDIEDKIVTRFLTSVYSFDHSSPAIWAHDKKSINSSVVISAHHLYLKYNPIGSNRPGSNMAKSGNGLKEEATVICVKEAEYLPGAKVKYCIMLREFLKINAVQLDTGPTCYWIPPSVMTAKPSTADKRLVTVDHFNKACRAMPGKPNFPVAPLSDEQKEALNLGDRATGLKGVLLPGSLTAPFDKALLQTAGLQFTPKEANIALFSYKIARNKTSYEVEKMKVPADPQWPAGYPIKEEPNGVTRGLMYWNKREIRNVEVYRRAPIVCGSGPSVVTAFKCEDGWEIAHRKDHSICYKALKWNGCPSYDEAMNMCKALGASGAPMESQEEEMAIARSMTKLWGAGSEEGILLGPQVDNVGDEFAWQWENRRTKFSLVKYTRWYITGRPTWEKVCPNKSRFLGVQYSEGTCYKPKCVELLFHTGVPVGMTTMVCEHLCVSHGHQPSTSVACAKKAQRIAL